MSELFNEMVIEKLEAIELLLKAERTGQNQPVDLSPINHLLSHILQELKQCKTVPDAVPKIQAGLNNVQTGFSSLDQYLRSVIKTPPAKKNYPRFKTIMLCVGLSLTTLLSGWQWVSTYMQLQNYRDNDLKFRYLKFLGTKAARQMCFQADALLPANRDSLNNAVLTAEKCFADPLSCPSAAGEKTRK